MAAEYPPFMFGYGCIENVILKIQDHDIPEVFSHDYLRFTLGFARESDRAFIPLAKRIGLINAEGKPTSLYLKVRDPEQAAEAMREALKIGYPMFYAKYPNLHTLDRKTLASMVGELTGLEVGHTSLRAIVGTFLTLKAIAEPDEPRMEDRRRMPDRRRS